MSRLKGFQLSIDAIVALAIMVAFNIALFHAAGYFVHPEWNWDMERILPFIHLNRLETGSHLWELKLQRLPALFPLYPLLVIAKIITQGDPVRAVNFAVSLSALLIQASTVCIGYIMLQGKKSLALISFLLMTIEIFLTLTFPAYDSYIKAAFRLHWHGDSTLICILLFVIALLASRSRQITKRTDHLRLVTPVLLGTSSFLGSLSSSLFIVIAIFPCFFCALIGREQNTKLLVKSSGHMGSVQVNPRRCLLSINAYSNILSIGLASCMGLLTLKLLREGCTPTIIGDSSITRSAILALIGNDSILLVPFFSLVLWSIVYALSRREISSIQNYSAEFLLFLHSSLPILLVIYIFTSWGDQSVFIRYGGVFSFLLPLAIVVLILSLSQKLIINLVAAFFAVLSTTSISYWKRTGFDFEPTPYSNPIHVSLSKEYSRLSSNAYRDSRTVRPQILVTDGIGNMATSPVLEFLSAHKIRYSQLAGIADPRLFDQSPEEFVRGPAKKRIFQSSLSPDDIRDYEFILTTKTAMPNQIAVVGMPRQVIPLDVADAPYQYLLLDYRAPYNSKIKKHLSSYLNSHRDISCNRGVGWPTAIYNFVYKR